MGDILLKQYRFVARQTCRYGWVRLGGFAVWKKNRIGIISITHIKSSTVLKMNFVSDRFSRPYIIDLSLIFLIKLMCVYIACANVCAFQWYKKHILYYPLNLLRNNCWCIDTFFFMSTYCIILILWPRR